MLKTEWVFFAFKLIENQASVRCSQKLAVQANSKHSFDAEYVNLSL